MTKKVTELDVSMHPSGNYTLTRQDPGDRLPRDLDGDENLDLWTNPNAATFYRAVAAYMAKMVAAGEAFTYDDVKTPPPESN